MSFCPQTHRLICWNCMSSFSADKSIFMEYLLYTLFLSLSVSILYEWWANNDFSKRLEIQIKGRSLFFLKGTTNVTIFNTNNRLFTFNSKSNQLNQFMGATKKKFGGWFPFKWNKNPLITCIWEFIVPHFRTCINQWIEPSTECLLIEFIIRPTHIHAQHSTHMYIWRRKHEKRKGKNTAKKRFIEVHISVNIHSIHFALNLIYGIKFLDFFYDFCVFSEIQSKI